jgi:hypothetical protein
MLSYRRETASLFDIIKAATKLLSNHDQNINIFSALTIKALTLTVQDDHPGDVLAASEIFVLMPLWLNH